MLQMGFLKLLYGADMRENSEKYPCTFSHEPPYEVTSTPWLSNSDIKMLKNCEDALDRLYNSGRFLYTLDYLTNEVGFSPFDIFLIALSNLWWIFAIAGLLVIAAIVGIVIFTKKKKGEKK
jgi:hypothetical protein